MKSEQMLSTSSPLSNISDKELLLLFHSQNWLRMGAKRRLFALQELENRRALADGRPALKLYIDPSMGPNTYGGHGTAPDGREIIVINPRFLHGGRLSAFSGALALSTILHEGRHAFQRHAIKDDFKNVPIEQKIDWSAVMVEFGGVYTSEHPVIYFIQSIEMDARRFARRKLFEVQRIFKAMGMEDRAFTVQLQKDLAMEAIVISRVRQTLTLESINKYEKMVLDHLKKTRPDLDVTNLHPFEHVRYILMHPEIKDPMDMLTCLDKMADTKLGLKPDISLDRFKSSHLGNVADANLLRFNT